jgi:hypothetical protein
MVTFFKKKTTSFLMNFGKNHENKVFWSAKKWCKGKMKEKNQLIGFTLLLSLTKLKARQLAMQVTTWFFCLQNINYFPYFYRPKNEWKIKKS